MVIIVGILAVLLILLIIIQPSYLTDQIHALTNHQENNFTHYDKIILKITALTALIFLILIVCLQRKLL